MSAAKHLIVYVYDVTRNSVRRKISELLEGHGSRVQFSVFECRLSLLQAGTLLRQLEILKDEGDSIRMYVLDEFGRKASASAGGAPIAEKSEFWLL